MRFAAALSLLLLGCVNLSGPGQSGDVCAPGVLSYVADGPSYGLPGVPTNLSGISYDADRSSYWLVQNKSDRIYEYEEDLVTLRRTVTLADMHDDDFEGITALGSNRLAIANEKNELYVFSVSAGANDEVVSLDPWVVGVERLQLPERDSWNSGVEALCFDPAEGPAGALFAFQEKRPRKLFRIPLPVGAPGYELGFDAEASLDGVLIDVSGCVVERGSGNFLLISHESSRLVEVRRDGGVVATLELPGLWHDGAAQYEGVTLGPNGRLVVVSEPLFGTQPSRAQTYRPAPCSP